MSKIITSSILIPQPAKVSERMWIRFSRSGFDHNPCLACSHGATLITPVEIEGKRYILAAASYVEAGEHTQASVDFTLAKLAQGIGIMDESKPGLGVAALDDL